MISHRDIPNPPLNPTTADLDRFDDLIFAAWKHNLGWIGRLKFKLGMIEEPKSCRYFGMGGPEIGPDTPLEELERLVRAPTST